MTAEVKVELLNILILRKNDAELMKTAVSE